MDTKSLTQGIQQLLLDLDEQITANASDPNWDIQAVSETFFQLDSFKGQLSIIIKSLESILIEKMVDKEAISLDSGAMLVKEWSKSRKAWQHKDLASAVAERIETMAIDMDTGERTMTTSEMIQAILDYVQPSYWRVGALSNIGLNADAFCEASDPQPKIRIEKAS